MTKDNSKLNHVDFTFCKKFKTTGELDVRIYDAFAGDLYRLIT